MDRIPIASTRSAVSASTAVMRQKLQNQIVMDKPITHQHNVSGKYSKKYINKMHTGWWYLQNYCWHLYSQEKVQVILILMQNKYGIVGVNIHTVTSTLNSVSCKLQLICKPTQLHTSWWYINPTNRPTIIKVIIWLLCCWHYHYHLHYDSTILKLSHDL